MDAKQYGESDIEHAKERIEAKREQFAGGPEPGWERLEEATAEAKREAMERSAMTASPAQQTTQPAPNAPLTPPEHPAGVGKQCTMCGAYNEFDATTCWECSRPLAPEQSSG
jgi:hypothetical protein